MKADDFFSSDFWIAGSINWHGMAQQANTGIGFAKEEAVKLVAHVTDLMSKIENEIEPQLPPRPLNKGELDFYRVPQKPFNKDGSYSANFTKWLEKVGGKLFTQRDVKIGEEVFPIVGGSETVKTGVMKLGNQDDLKDWLIREGWEPTLWNYKKDARGKPMRDEKGQLIQTSPKMSDKGRLCPNLELMSGALVQPVVTWLSLRNRKSVVEGWLENERLAWDGRLSAGASGLTPTFRFKHTVCVNVPKADPSVTLGKEMRSLFISSRPGYKFVGWDAVALEGRMEAHYCYPFEGGEAYAEQLLDGDIHSKNALIFYEKELGKLGITHEFEGIKDDARFIPYRNRSKNGKYSLTFGAQPKKLASTLGIPEHEAVPTFDAFWDGNTALKGFRDRITAVWESIGKKYIVGLDGRKVYTRSKHALVNSAFQSGGAIVMEYSAIFMDKWLGGLVLDNCGVPCYSYKGQYVYRVGFWHDELATEVPEDLAEEIKALGVKSIEMAGKHLKLRVPLAGSGKVGDNWASVH